MIVAYSLRKEHHFDLKNRCAALFGFRLCPLAPVRSFDLGQMSIPCAGLKFNPNVLFKFCGN